MFVARVHANASLQRFSACNPTLFYQRRYVRRHNGELRSACCTVEQTVRATRHVFRERQSRGIHQPQQFLEAIGSTGIQVLNNEKG